MEGFRNLTMSMLRKGRLRSPHGKFEMWPFYLMCSTLSRKAEQSKPWDVTPNLSVAKPDAAYLTTTVTTVERLAASD